MSNGISKDEMLAWRHQPVTRAMEAGIRELAIARKLRLASVCGKDSQSDLQERGHIQGMEESWDLDNIIKEMYTDDDKSEGSGPSVAY